jgi:hypothetical protein
MTRKQSRDRVLIQLGNKFAMGPLINQLMLIKKYISISRKLILPIFRGEIYQSSPLQSKFDINCNLPFVMHYFIIKNQTIFYLDVRINFY